MIILVERASLILIERVTRILILDQLRLRLMFSLCSHCFHYDQILLSSPLNRAIITHVIVCIRGIPPFWEPNKNTVI